MKILVLRLKILQCGKQSITILNSAVFTCADKTVTCAKSVIFIKLTILFFIGSQGEKLFRKRSLPKSRKYFRRNQLLKAAACSAMARVRSIEDNEEDSVSFICQ